MGAFKLDGALDAYIANYSLGMKQKIYMAAALLSGAGNFILDEPFNGLVFSEAPSAFWAKFFVPAAFFLLHA